MDNISKLQHLIKDFAYGRQSQCSLICFLEDLEKAGQRTTPVARYADNAGL